MEQGPILESKGLPLGVVTGIAGQTRQHVMMTGIQVDSLFGKHQTGSWSHDDASSVVSTA